MLELAAPPSKSMSHRMLIGAALAQGESCIHNALLSKDIERTMHILSQAGAHMQLQANGDIHVRGCGGMLRGADSASAALECDVHESGTTCRLLTAILATGQGYFRICGASRMYERPIGQLVDVLHTMGARIDYAQKPMCPPLLLHAQGLHAQEVSIALDESSQYLSGLLLAAPLCTEGQQTCINVGGNNVVSWPYVGLTLQSMEDFGVSFTVQCRDAACEDAPQTSSCPPPDAASWAPVDWRTLQRVVPGHIRFCVPRGAYAAGEYSVEGDWSGASYLLAAGAVGPKAIRVTGLRENSVQGDKALVNILRRMGAQITFDTQGVCVQPAPLHGIDVAMGDCPDIVPTVAAVATFATGVTQIHDVAHLRIKESDRIAAPAQELRKAGVVVEECADGLKIFGRGAVHIPEGTVFCAHGDHRIAMSMALLGLGGRQPHTICVDTPDVVTKSFPHFWKLWAEVVAV